MVGCKYYANCGNKENCTRCTGYEPVSEKAKFIIDIMNEIAKSKEYKVFRYNMKDIGSVGAYVITPNGNLLLIQPATWFGASITLKYKPNAKCGSGCSCLDDNDGITKFNIDMLKGFEQNGLRFARQLKANLYSSIEEAMENIWDKESLIPLN